MQARHQDRQTRVTPPERYRPPRRRSESPRAVRRVQARAVRVGEAAGMVEANLKRLVVVQRVPERTRRDVCVRIRVLSTKRVVPVDQARPAA
jgi:hypothetical protein